MIGAPMKRWLLAIGKMPQSGAGKIGVSSKCWLLAMGKKVAPQADLALGRNAGWL
jgi:hypothetical protein